MKLTRKEKQASWLKILTKRDKIEHVADTKAFVLDRLIGICIGCLVIAIFYYLPFPFGFISLAGVVYAVFHFVGLLGEWQNSIDYRRAQRKKRQP